MMGSIFKHHPSRDRTGAAAGRGHPSCTGPDWHRHPVPDPPRVSLSAVATTLTAPTRLRPPTRGPHRVPRTVSCVSHRSHDAMGRVPAVRGSVREANRYVVTRRRWFRNKPNRGARGSGTQAPHRPLSKSLFLTIQSFTFHSSGSPSLRDRGWSSHSVWVRVVLPMRVAGLDVAGHGLCRVLFFCALLTPRVKRDNRGSTWDQRGRGSARGHSTSAGFGARTVMPFVARRALTFRSGLRGRNWVCFFMARASAMCAGGWCSKVPFIPERQAGMNLRHEVQSLIH